MCVAKQSNQSAKPITSFSTFLRITEPRPHWRMPMEDGINSPPLSYSENSKEIVNEGFGSSTEFSKQNNYIIHLKNQNTRSHIRNNFRPGAKHTHVSFWWQLIFLGRKYSWNVLNSFEVILHCPSRIILCHPVPSSYLRAFRNHSQNQISLWKSIECRVWSWTAWLDDPIIIQIIEIDYANVVWWMRSIWVMCW